MNKNLEPLFFSRISKLNYVSRDVLTAIYNFVFVCNYAMDFKNVAFS